MSVSKWRNLYETAFFLVVVATFIGYGEEDASGIGAKRCKRICLWFRLDSIPDVEGEDQETFYLFLFWPFHASFPPVGSKRKEFGTSIGLLVLMASPIDC